MTLALFDLDNTLIADDSDYLWGKFLVDEGLVDRLIYDKINAQFYEDYQNGTLDMMAFLRFALAPLAAHPLTLLHEWRNDFIRTIITPLLLEKATQLIETHRAQGDTLLVITATNAFITAPIAALYGIEHLIATTPEFVDGKYTGNVVGTPCFQEGKVTRLKAWLTQHNKTLAGSYFYSDSHNDLPLLNLVDNPVAVDPDDKLHDIAQAKQWKIISLRDTATQ